MRTVSLVELPGVAQRLNYIEHTLDQLFPNFLISDPPGPSKIRLRSRGHCKPSGHFRSEAPAAIGFFALQYPKNDDFQVLFFCICHWNKVAQLTN